MTDFIIWSLVILLTFLKCIFFAVAIIFIWILIGKYSPKTSEKISNYGRNIKDTFNTKEETKKESK
jgi:membrane protein required for beta-lactamase induction